MRVQLARVTAQQDSPRGPGSCAFRTRHGGNGDLHARCRYSQWEKINQDVDERAADLGD